MYTEKLIDYNTVERNNSVVLYACFVQCLYETVKIRSKYHVMVLNTTYKLPYYANCRLYHIVNSLNKNIT